MTLKARRGGLAARLLLCCSGAVFGCLLLAGSASAAPPANDAFASAATLSGTTAGAGGTNVEATKQVGEPDHADDQGGASVWYVWTAPNSGTYQLNTCGSDFDTLLAVYTGSAVNSLTRIASSDQSASCFDQSVLYFQAVSGTTYHFAVDGWSDGGSMAPSTGSVGIVLQQITSAPANDNFASAQALQSRTENVVQGTNVLATKQSGEPNHAGDGGGASVWYSWVAPVSGMMRMNVCAADFETLFAVYTGSAVNSLTQVASAPGDCELTFNAVQGTTYRIAVDGYSNNGGQPAAVGDFRLQTHLIHPPPNDDFANSQLISGASTRVTGSNVDASVQAGEPAHFPGGPFASVWYSWTAPATGQVTIDTCPSDFDTVLAVYTGNAVSALTRIASNDDACGFGASRVTFAASSGTTYRIAVDGFDTGSIDLGVALVTAKLQAPPPPDTKAPQSKINKLIVDSEHHRATIRFTANEPGSSFKCKLDHGPFKACHSPKTYRHLDAGKHKVKIAASDAAGNLDTSPAVKSFKIEP